MANAWLLGLDALKELLSGLDRVPGKGVVAWASNMGNGKLFVSEMTWASLRSMAEAETSPSKRQAWISKIDNDVPIQFGSRLLPVDRAVLQTWSRIANVGQASSSASMEESIEVATALHHGLVYVTAQSDLAASEGCPTESPW